MEGHWNLGREGRCQMPTFWGESIKLELEFQWGGGVQLKKPCVGGKEIILHYHMTDSIKTQCAQTHHDKYFYIPRFIFSSFHYGGERQVSRSCLLKASTVECWSIPLINTPDWHSIDPQSTINWYLMDTPFDTWSTLIQHLGWQSVKSRLIFRRCI